MDTVSQIRSISNENNHIDRSEPPQLDAVRLAYQSYGQMSENDSKSPVVIMHGFLGSKRNWNSVSKAIHARTKRRVIAVDARNHGQSPHHEDHTYSHLAADIVMLMQNLLIPSAAVLGHSMGARAMMLLALKFVQVVSSLIVVDMSPVRESRNYLSMGKYFDMMRKVEISPRESLGDARQMVDEIFSKEISDKGLREFLLMNLIKYNDGHFGWRINIDVLEKHFVTDLSSFPEFAKTLQYHGPTLFVVGTNSDYITEADVPEIKKLFPNSQMAYIEGAGHWLHAEKPQEFIDTVSEFLNRNI